MFSRMYTYIYIHTKGQQTEQNEQIDFSWSLMRLFMQNGLKFGLKCDGRGQKPHDQSFLSYKMLIDVTNPLSLHSCKHGFATKSGVCKRGLPFHSQAFWLASFFPTPLHRFRYYFHILTYFDSFCNMLQNVVKYILSKTKSSLWQPWFIVAQQSCEIVPTSVCWKNILEFYVKGDVWFSKRNNYRRLGDIFFVNMAIIFIYFHRLQNLLIARSMVICGHSIRAYSHANVNRDCPIHTLSCSGIRQRRKMQQVW